MAKTFSEFRQRNRIDTFYEITISFLKWMRFKGYLQSIFQSSIYVCSSSNIFIAKYLHEPECDFPEDSLAEAQKRITFNSKFEEHYADAGFDYEFWEKLADKDDSESEFAEKAKLAATAFLNCLQQSELILMRNPPYHKLEHFTEKQVVDKFLFHMNQRENLSSNETLRKEFETDFLDLLTFEKKYFNDERICYLYTECITSAFLDVNVFVFPYGNLDYFFMFNFTDDN